MAMHAPDSGFSWVIVLCCSYIHFALFGMFRSSGVMYVALLQNYDVSREEASWPFALCAAVFQLVGPLSSVLIHRISQRKVCLLGSAIATLGVGSCYFAHSILWINICFGLVHGLGFGFVVTVVPVTLNQYFVKYKATAMGIAFAGGSASSLIFPGVMEWLLQHYTLRDSFLLLSGVVMNTLVASSLMREPPWLKTTEGKYTASPLVELAINPEYHDDTCDKSQQAISSSNILRDSALNQAGDASSKNEHDVNQHLLVGGKKIAMTPSEQAILSYPTGKGSPMVHDSALNQADDVTSKNEHDVSEPLLVDGKKIVVVPSQQAISSCSSGNGNILRDRADALHKNDHEVSEPLLVGGKKVVIVPKKTTTAEGIEPRAASISLGRSLRGILREPSFHLITFTMGVYFLAVHSFFMVIVDFAKDKGIPESQAIYIISVFSLTDLVGRAGLGWVTDRGVVGRRAMVALNLALIGVLYQAYPLVDSLPAILALAAVNGLAVGSSITLFFVLQAECLGMDRLVLVVGLISFVNGVLSLLRPGIIGLFRDVIGAYNWMFHCIGMSCLVFAAMWLVESRKERSAALTSKRLQAGKV